MNKSDVKIYYRNNTLYYFSSNIEIRDEPLKKYSDSQCCWKKYSDFGGGKKKSDSEFLSYNLMLYTGKKLCASRDKKNKYSNSCCPKKKNSERNKKP